MRYWTAGMERADALIFGRVTYEMMESAWRRPSSGTWPDWMDEWEIPFAETIDRAKKYVVSSTLSAVDWNAELLRGEGADLPDLSDTGLLERADEWLLPYLANKRSEAELRALDLTEALRAALGWEGQQLLDRLAPAHFETPLGRRVPIDYDGAAPGITVRLQELFGVTEHPSVGPKRLPLRITLLSPGGKPVQVTMDLPGFWANSYADVRKDMRGRYPRHPWPEDPREAEPTTRAKPRGT